MNGRLRVDDGLRSAADAKRLVDGGVMEQEVPGTEEIDVR